MGAPTTIRARDCQLEEQDASLTHDLPLVAIEYESWPQERIRLSLQLPGDALQVVEIEDPKTISLLGEEGANNSPDKSLSFGIETASRLFFVHTGLMAD